MNANIKGYSSAKHAAHWLQYFKLTAEGDERTHTLTQQCLESHLDLVCGNLLGIEVSLTAG